MLATDDYVHRRSVSCLTNRTANAAVSAVSALASAFPPVCEKELYKGKASTNNTRVMLLKEPIRSMLSENIFSIGAHAPVGGVRNSNYRIGA
jgi:hypothetical protein